MMLPKKSYHIFFDFFLESDVRNKALWTTTYVCIYANKFQGTNVLRSTARIEFTVVKTKQFPLKCG